VLEPESPEIWDHFLVEGPSTHATPGPRSVPLNTDAHRESDLLAFEIAIERSQPGAVMSGYNMINGDYAGGNDHLLNDVLKGAWGYPGWVMSDWGATLDWEFALAGLDQESGLQIDLFYWDTTPFVEPLKEAYVEGKLPKERLSDMVRRILRSMFAVGSTPGDRRPTLTWRHTTRSPLRPPTRASCC